MANKILLDEQDGTPKQIVFRDSTDYSPTANLQFGTPTLVQLDLTSLANTAARQSTKADLGTVRAPQYAVRCAFEFAATPTAGNIVEIYWAPSSSSTAATGNAAAVSGADSAYSGYSSNLAASVKQLQLIGIFICTAQATATVQVAECGSFRPIERYGSVVVYNNSGAAFHSDAVDSAVYLDPVYDEIQ